VGRVLAGVVQVVQVAPLNWLVVPAFVWLMVTFRRGDLAVMLQQTPREPTPRRLPRMRPGD